MRQNLFRNSYGIKKKQKTNKLAVSFNHTYRYINDVPSINNHNFHNNVHLIYPDELEIKDTTESDKSASVDCEISGLTPENRLGKLTM
jgi:hypothetical protein